MSGNFGLNISLPSGTLSQLQRNRGATISSSFQQHDLLDLRNAHDYNDGDEEEEEDDMSVELLQNKKVTAQSQITFIKPEDREIMAFVPSDSGDSDASENNLQNSDEYQRGQEDTDYSDGVYSDGTNNNEEVGEFDNISISPPDTMPLLVVDFEKLCGYTPTDRKEAQNLEVELCEALLGAKSKMDDYEGTISSPASIDKQSTTTETNYGDGFSLDFTTRAIELLETGVARHCDTKQQQNEFAIDERNEKFNYAFVPYPEYMKLPKNNDNAETTIMETSKVWKRIKHPHDIPVVNKLLDLLSKCSRDLMWKYDMAIEIRRIAKEERQWQEEKQRRKELKLWRTKTRPDELAKLYDVREAFILKLETVRKKYDGYVKERDERVQAELLRRKEQGFGTGGIASLDWDGKVTFAFDDDVEEIVQKILREKQENDEGFDASEHSNCRSPSDDSEECYDDGYYCDEGDHELSDVESSSQKASQHEFNDILPQRNNDDRLRKARRAKAASKRMKKKLETERENAKAAELRTKIELAHKEEQQVRLMCISTDEKLAMVMVNDLEQRLEKVDNLLDSLQMDAWNDEEEGFLEDNESDSDHEEDIKLNIGEMNLLDNILAMVLGTMPPMKDSNAQSHFTHLKLEHKSIVDDWKNTFGRIPKLHQKKKDENMSVGNVATSSKAETIWDNSDEEIILQENALQAKKFQTNFTIPDDWEDEADSCDDTEPSDVTKNREIDHLQRNEGDSKNHRSSSSTVGLRPGGKIR